MEIILIHGTFASGAAWTLKASPFQSTFMEYFPGTPITEFVWSGGNSHSARLTAAEDLVALIKERICLGIEGPFVLVGHSYGGLAAVYAMRELERNAATAGRVKVACLNTPFLAFAPRGFRILQAIAHVFNVVLNFGAPVLPLLAVNTLLATIGLLLGIRASESSGIDIVPLLIYLIIAGVGTAFGAKLVNWIFQAARSWSKHYAATISADCESGALLNVRTDTDEAPWYLRSWSALNNLWGLVPWIGFMASAVLAAGMAIATSIFLLLLLAMGESAQLTTAFGREGFPARADVSAFYGQLGALLAMPVILFVATPLFVTSFVVGVQITLLFMLVTRCLPVSFGDFTSAAILLKVHIVTRPSGGMELKTVTVPRQGLGLSHSSVHESESAIQAVVQWIQQVTGEQRQSAAGS